MAITNQERIGMALELDVRVLGIAASPLRHAGIELGTTLLAGDGCVVDPCTAPAARIGESDLRRLRSSA